MFRLTRPAFQALKSTTGIYGLKVHQNPLPELLKTYQSTLTALSALPSTSVSWQSVEALTQHKLNIVQKANGDVEAAEKELDEGHIEESLDIAQDELKLVAKVAEWKAYVLDLSGKVLAAWLTVYNSQMGAFGGKTRAGSMGIRGQDCYSRDNLIITVTLYSFAESTFSLCWMSN